MQLKILATLAFGALSFISQAQGRQTLVTIGNTSVGADEFIANYRKNNQNLQDPADKKTPGEYLDLFINFKLKVLEAEKEGYDTLKSFRDELSGYRKELAQPYLTSISFDEKLLDNAYYRTTHERRASHILIRVSPDASASDTLAAWDKIMNIRTQFLNGKNFNELAVQYSEDPSAQTNRGDLGYFAAFQMVFPFEDAAYKTPIGQVSQPVRTRFGYHLIYVQDERPASGEMKVAHIMKMVPKNADLKFRQQQKAQIDSIYQLAKRGDDFAELAKNLSEDKRSAINGGEMPWFTRTTMVPEFSAAAFNLPNNGDISEVIETPYGYHIIKRLQYKPVPKFEEIRDLLITKIKSNPDISKHSQDNFVEKLKNDYQLQINQDVFQQFLRNAMTSDKKGTLNAISENLKAETLATFSNKKLTCGQFVEYLETKKLPTNPGLSEELLNDRLKEFIKLQILAFEDSQLEQKYPDFANMMREYHDGILLFNISNDKIWNVAGKDTAGLQRYFNNKSTKKYYWQERFKGMVIQVADQATRDKVDEILAAGDVSAQELSDLINTNGQHAIDAKEGSFEKGDDPVVDYFVWNGPKPSGLDETLNFVRGNKIGPEMKSLTEAWGLYSADYQDYLEKEWVKSLRKNWKIKVNKKALKTIPSI